MDNILTICSEHGLLNGKQMIKFAVEGYPACGTPSEVLKHHRLDGYSIADRVLEESD
jgi:hypothetical protein